MFWLRNKKSNFQLPTIGTCIGMEHVISELCYKGTILQQNYSKRTIYNPIILLLNSMVIFFEPQHDRVVSKYV